MLPGPVHLHPLLLCPPRQGHRRCPPAPPRHSPHWCQGDRPATVLLILVIGPLPLKPHPAVHTILDHGGLLKSTQVIDVRDRGHKGILQTKLVPVPPGHTRPRQCTANRLELGLMSVKLCVVNGSLDSLEELAQVSTSLVHQATACHPSNVAVDSTIRVQAGQLQFSISPSSPLASQGIVEHQSACAA